MTLSTKILVWLGVLAALGALSFLIYKDLDNAKQLSALQQQNIQQKALIDGLVQSSNQYTTKDDLNNFIQSNTDNLKAIQDNLNSLGAQITAANTVTANSSGQQATNVHSSGTGTTNPNPTAPTVIPCPSGGSVNCPNTDPFGYQLKQQQLTLNEDFPNLQVPIGSIGFSAWQQAPWSLNIAPREYNVTSVIGQDQNQRIYVDNQFTVKVNGKDYEVPIKTAQTKQVLPPATWSWWNPGLFMGLDGGLNLTNIPPLHGEVSPSLNLGIMSYGTFKTQPDISVLQMGLGYGFVSKKPELVITPIALNVGKVVPLLHNTYVAPSLQIGIDGSVNAMLGLRLGL
jgi:hypothetical protein